MPKPKTQAERTKKSEDAKRAKGMRKLWVWGYPESAPRIRTFAKLLEKEVEDKHEL